MNVFNSVHKDIEFTLEVPPNNILNFLDVSLSVKEHYKVFRKYCHSGISLKKESWLPFRVKFYHFRNSFNYVQERCSDTSSREESINLMKNQLLSNGFSQRDLDFAHRKRSTRSSNHLNATQPVHSFLKLQFLSDSSHRKISKLVKKYKLPVTVVERPGMQLRNFLKTKSNSVKQCQCTICSLLPNYYTCKSRFVVYKFTCKYCQKFYIGSTNRPFIVRYKEHRRSILNRDDKSALSEHLKICHSDGNIDSFEIDLLTQQHDPVLTRIAEARSIDYLKPQLNRKHERY